MPLPPSAPDPINGAARALLARRTETTLSEFKNDLLRELYSKSKLLDETLDELSSLALHVDGLLSEVDRPNELVATQRVELAARDMVRER